MKHVADDFASLQQTNLAVSGPERLVRMPGAIASSGFLVEELANRGLSSGILRQHAAARHLGDVGRFKVNLQRESVHQPCQLDSLVIEPADELA